MTDLIGLVAGLVGLYQFNVVVASVLPGDVALVVDIGGECESRAVHHGRPVGRALAALVGAGGPRQLVPQATRAPVAPPLGFERK